MRNPWEVLCEAGVPYGAARPRSARPMDAAAVAEALHSVLRDSRELEVSEQECLVAWLAAFRHHWPDRFAVLLGPLGDEAYDRCVLALLDRNRYLKLRRIATENLSRLL